VSGGASLATPGGGNTSTGSAGVSQLGGGNAADGALLGVQMGQLAASASASGGHAGG
jgi:hypothetical protein